MDIIKDNILIEIFKNHNGHELKVQLRNGEIKSVWNIAWGYDIGDEYAHITSNISPEVIGSTIDFFYSHEITRIIEVESNRTIFEL
jgi:hypothetical protein